MLKLAFLSFMLYLRKKLYLHPHMLFFMTKKTETRETKTRYHTTTQTYTHCYPPAADRPLQMSRLTGKSQPSIGRRIPLTLPQIINGEVGHFQDVEESANIGTSVNQQDEEGITLAIFCCDKYAGFKDAWVSKHAGVNLLGGSKGLLQYVLDQGANAELADNSGQTALIHSVKWVENYDCAAVLVRHGVVLDAFDMYGCTALWHASRQGYMSTLQLLVQSGADIDRASNDGNTPIAIARWRGHTAVVAYLTIELNWKRRRNYATMLNSLKGAPTNSKIMRVFQCYDLARLIGTYL